MFGLSRRVAARQSFSARAEKACWQAISCWGHCTPGACRQPGRWQEIIGKGKKKIGIGNLPARRKRTLPA